MESMRSRKTEMTLLVTPELSNFGGNVIDAGDVSSLPPNANAVFFTNGHHFLGHKKLLKGLERGDFFRALMAADVLEKDIEGPDFRAFINQRLARFNVDLSSVLKQAFDTLEVITQSA